MFFIPIGTKSTLALKPKLTIGLIATNIIVAIISFPLMIQTEKKCFEVQRERLATELRLLVKDRSHSDDSYEYQNMFIDGSFKNIEKTSDYSELEFELIESMSLLGVTFEDLEDYEEELKGKTEQDFIHRPDGMADDFAEWKRLIAKEEAAFNRNINFSLGLIPSKMGRIHTFFSHLFLHGGIWHLLGNMLFLWVVGCLLEDSWGRIPFLMFYLAGGALAGLAHCLQDTSSVVPLIGASGAIAAAMGAFTIKHFWTKIKFFYFFMFFFRPYWGTFHLPAFVFLPFWFIEQLVMKSLTDFVGGSDVAYLAHIAGYASGVTVALGARITGFEDRFITPRVHKNQVNAGVLKDPRFDKACDMLNDGRTEGAISLFNRIIADRPDDVNTLQDIAIIYKENGLKSEYRKISSRAMKSLMRESRLEEAAELALNSIRVKQCASSIDPQVLLRIGKWLSEQNRAGEAHDIYSHITQNKNSPQVTAKAYIKLAKLLNYDMINPKDALTALKRARSLGLGDEWTERIQELEDAIREEHPEFCGV